MTRKEFLFIAIATLITAIAWVVFDIIHKRSIVQLPPNTQKIIEPVDPNFNINAIK